MTSKAPTYVHPEQVYDSAIETAVSTYERTKNIQATADATADTIYERFGFPTVFGILAFKMASSWWLLKLSGETTIGRLLTNVLSALIANDLAERYGLDQRDTAGLNVSPRPVQDVSGGDSRPASSPKVKTRPKRLSKPAPTK